MKNDFNIFIKLFISFVIIRHIVSLITSFLQITMAISGDVPLLPIIWNIALSISMVGILLCLFNKKQWSLYLFGGLQIINVIVQSTVFGSDILNSLFVAIVMCSIMAALLCLKENGVSAWRLLFPKSADEENEHDISIDKEGATIETIFYEDKDNNKEVDVTESAKNGIEPPINKVHEEAVVASCITETETKCHQKQDTWFDVSLPEPPKNEDGSIDYDNMTPIQQFAYTYKTESIEAALTDLEADIKVLEKSIRKIKKKLNSTQGGSRAKLRDSLRIEQEKLDELYGLRNKYSTKQKRGWKAIAIAIGSITIFLILVIILLRLNNTDLTQRINNDNDKRYPIGYPIEDTYAYLLEKGYHKFNTLDEFLVSMENAYYRETVLETLVNEGYNELSNIQEAEAYLGYTTLRYVYYVAKSETQAPYASQEDTFHIPISFSDGFEKKYPTATLEMINNNTIIKIYAFNREQYISNNPSARPVQIIKINDLYPTKRRLLYYSLLGSGRMSKKLLGNIEDFIETLNSKEKIKDFYWQLIDYGFSRKEIGSEYGFCSNISTDLLEDDLSRLYSVLAQHGYTLEELGEWNTFCQNMQDEEYRHMLFEDIKERGDLKIGKYEDYEKRVMRAVRRRWLYDKLSTKYLYLVDSYQVFYEKMNDEEFRNTMYDIAIRENLNVGTREWFNNAIK